MKRYLSMLLVAILVAGCSDEDKAKIAKLEAENQQLKARLQVMETDHPPIDLAKLQQFGRDQLGGTMPDTNKPGFLSARATLAGTNSVRAAIERITPLTTKAEIKTNIVQTLYVLQDMWPAYMSSANQTIDPMFQPCRDLPVLTRMAVEAAQGGVESVLHKASDLEKLVRFQCSFALSAAVLKSQEVK